MDNENEKVDVDFEGERKTEFEKILIPEDSYNFKVTSISPQKMPAWGKKDKLITKLIFSLELIDMHAGKKNVGKTISHFMTPTILKAPKAIMGKKAYSNSKLYDLLADLNLLEKAKVKREQIGELVGLVAFLSGELVGREVRASVKIVNANTEGAYSSVAKISRFVEGEGLVAEKKFFG
jgi:hypothetical protein